MALTRLVNLDQNAEFNLQESSRPMQAVTGYQGIQVSIQKERRQLEYLLVAIKAEPLFENNLGIYETIIGHALADLNDEMIVEAKYLLPFTTAADEHGTVEEIEVEQEMALEAEAAVEQAVRQEFQVETEVDIEQEQRVEIEIEEEREEPRAYYTHSHFPHSSFFPDELQGVFKFLYALPHPGSFCTWGYASNWEHNLWINGQWPKHRQVLGPSVLLVVDTKTKNVNSVLGTVKDADTNFENYPSKHRDNTSFVCMHYKFDDQRAMDEVLKTVPQECRADAVKHIVFAKLCYAVDCHFTEDEIPVLKELWATLPDQAKNALPIYLRRYFPEDSSAILQHLEI